MNIHVSLKIIWFQTSFPAEVFIVRSERPQSRRSFLRDRPSGKYIYLCYPERELAQMKNLVLSETVQTDESVHMLDLA